VAPVTLWISQYLSHLIKHGDIYLA
jgi:hypothetical protein